MDQETKDYIKDHVVQSTASSMHALENSTRAEFVKMSGKFKELQESIYRRDQGLKEIN